MKILYVVHDMYVGGVATIVNNLMHGMRNKDNEVHLIILKDTVPEIEILCDNVNVLKIACKADYLRGILKLKKLITKIDPDVIHSHTILAHILVLLLKSTYYPNIRIVCTEHSSLTIEQNKSLIFKLFSWLSEKPDKITFVSNFSLNSYLEKNIIHSKVKSEVIYNGVYNEKEDLENIHKIKKCYDISESCTTFCYIGRISPEKNIEMMLSAFSLLNSSDIRLLIVGDGNAKYVRELIGLSKSLGLNNVRFLGYRSDIVDIIKSVDCLLLSSIVEGLPTVVIETYSKKKIAISTICGGVEEVIRDSRFLSENNNEYDFADRISFYLNLRDKEKELISNQNYLIYKKYFDISIMVDNYYLLYQGIIND